MRLAAKSLHLAPELASGSSARDRVQSKHNVPKLQAICACTCQHAIAVTLAIDMELSPPPPLIEQSPPPRGLIESSSPARHRVKPPCFTSSIRQQASESSSRIAPFQRRTICSRAQEGYAAHFPMLKARSSVGRHLRDEAALAEADGCMNLSTPTPPRRCDSFERARCNFNFSMISSSLPRGPKSC